jgi:hypothetical protein
MSDQKTMSEEVFEDFCARRGIVCHRVPEGEARTPDYELICGDVQIVVEVKEIAANREERESDRVLAERGYGNVLSHTPGERVRKKVADCSPQIKARTVGIHPSILVVFERGRVVGHVDAYNIRVAMYGLEQIYLAVPPIGAGSPYATGIGHGPKRKMTSEHNTSISAIGALFKTGPNETHLHVYHNRFAYVPLQPTLLSSHGVAQFEIGEPTSGGASEWREIILADEP